MKKEKNRGNIGLVVCILIILIAAAALMAAVILYHKQQQGANFGLKDEMETQPTQKAEIMIPDITNPPATPAVPESTQEEMDEIEISSTSKDEDETGEMENNGTTDEEQNTAVSGGTTEAGDDANITVDETEAEQNTNELSDETEEESTADLSAGRDEEEKSTDFPDDETDSEAVADTSALAEETVPQNTLKDMVSLLAQIKVDTIADTGSHIVDITALTEMSGQEVRAKIESYTVPDMPYLDNAERVEGDFSNVLQRRYMEGIGETVTLQYGILTKNSAIRSFPTWQKLSDATNWEAFDYLQETMLMAGEGVVILHQSEDQIWSFVQGGSYYGWTETSAIAFCSREDMVGFMESERFAVVTVPTVTIEGINLRMGTRLPITGEQDDAYMIAIPKKDEENKLVWFEIAAAKDYLSEGYLEWSEEAVVSQAKKLLGTNYGWGDSNEFMDCSSTIRSVYNCFGVTLPRNSAWMPHSGLTVTDLQGLSAEEKREHISGLPRGSILIINGHAMMYIGEEDGVLSMLHNVTQYRPSAEEDIVRPMKCVITPIDICNTAGSNYQELYLYSIYLDTNLIE